MKKRVMIWTVGSMVALVALTGGYFYVDHEQTVEANRSSLATRQPRTFGMDRPGKPLAVAFVGDSLSAPRPDDSDPPAVFASIVSERLNRPVTVLDYAVPGTSTVHWCDPEPYQATVISRLWEQRPQYAMVMLGTNDSWRRSPLTADEYAANLPKLGQPLRACGAEVIYNAPPYTAPVDTRCATASKLLAGYADRIKGMGPAAGNVSAYDYFAAHRDELGPDGRHLPDVGRRSLGRLWAEAFLIRIGAAAAH